MQPSKPWSQADFGDRGAYPLALGSVFGVRWWSLDSSGWLKGVNATWGPEVNEATCLRTVETPSTAAFRAWARGEGPSVLPDQLPAVPVIPNPRHEAPDDGCACGFYAFWTAEPAPVRARFPVAGVIEGFGRTVVGSRGFRCGKARIVALHIPLAEGTSDVDVSLALEAESVLSDRYVVPVYATMRLMLVRHPPTADYAE